MQTLALVALGGNLFSSTGSPARTLCAALRALPAEGIRVVAVSRFWRSPAYPPGSGPDYVNAAAVVRTALGPEDTLAALHRIEATLGRTRTGGRWQARGIDLDLLGMGDLVEIAKQIEAAPADTPTERLDDLAHSVHLIVAALHPATGATPAN